MTNRDRASTFAKGLAVLDCFESGQGDMSMAEVARLTGFDRATARRLCLTLEHSGYLRKQGKAYSLTSKVVAVAGGYLSAQNIGKSVQPQLNYFAEMLDGEIALAVRDGTRAIYVARSAVSKARLSFGFSVGSTLPLLPTAVGRMLLAGCSTAQSASLLQSCPNIVHTTKTDVDLTSVEAKIHAAQAQGFAQSVDEFELGAAGIAVPLPDIAGAQAVLATTTSTNQFAREGELDRMLDILRKAAMSLR